MFGGLEVKKTNSTDGSTAGDTNNNNGASNSNGSSGFSFLNSSVAPTTEAPPPPAEPAASGFSFISSSSIDDDAAPVEAKAPSEPPSGFSFLSTTTTPPTTEPPEVPPPPTTNSFGLETATTSATIPTATTSSPIVTGAGVSFGTAMPAAKPKKKRNRATKVGVGAKATEIPQASSPLPPTNTQTAKPPATSTTRTEAMEASQRAEEFLEQKMRQTTGITTTSIPAIETSRSEDEMIAAAKAAAEEAQSMNATTNNKRGFGNRLGGLFRMSSGTGSGVGPTASQGSNQEVHAESVDDDDNDDEDDAPDSTFEHRKPSSTFEPPKPTTTTTTTASFQPPVTTSMQANTPTLTMNSLHHPPPLSLTPDKSLVNTNTSTTKKPKPRTATDDFHDMMRAFRQQVVQTMEQVSVMRTQRTGLLEERFLTVAKERYATQQRSEAEVKLQKAAETEDFELAAAMDTEIQAHDAEKAEYQAILTNIGQALEQLDEQKGQLVANVTNCFQAIQTKLQDFQKDEESKDMVESKEALARFSTAAKTISAENERLQQDLKHLERDAKLVADEREELESSISEQAGEYEKLRDIAKENLATVEQEIEDLRALLAEKMKKATTLRTEAAGHDEAVLRVRVKFSRQLTRVQKKEATVRDNQEEWALEKASYEKSKEEHDAEVTEHSEALLAHEKLLDTLSHEVEMAGTFESIVAKEIGFGSESEMDDELAELQAEVVKCEAAVSEAKAAAKVAADVLESLEAEKTTLETKLPQLEELKKAAAAKRDFKAAGLASKDAKESAARLAVVKEELASGACQRTEEAERNLVELEKTLAERQEVVRSREKESATRTMRKLSDNISRLQATKEKVCNNADTHSIQAVGAYVLDEQIAALDREGQTYGSKYGGWDEKSTTSVPAVEAEVASKTIREAAKKVPLEEASPTVSKEDQMAAFRTLSAELKQVEQDLESAAESEDYEKAAELQEILERLVEDVGKLDLTDEEMEAALSETPKEDAVETPEPAAKAEPVEEKEGDAATSNGDNRSHPIEDDEADTQPNSEVEGESPNGVGDSDDGKEE